MSDYKEPFYQHSESERIELTRQVKAANVPLMIRWSEMPTGQAQWSARSELAARYLSGAESVVDIGCGSMSLERALQKDQRYIPVDVARRDERTTVLDFNRPADLCKLPAAEAAAMLGVIEYCYQLEVMIRVLRKYSWVVASFNIVREGETVEHREAHGWVVHLTCGQLVRLFERGGWKLSNFQRFGSGMECLFVFR